jgi:hypothetical protein
MPGVSSTTVRPPRAIVETPSITGPAMVRLKPT